MAPRRKGTARGRMTAEQRAKVFKALSDPRRVDIVDTLAARGARCGTQLAEELGISLALLCHHWEVLVEAGVVNKERVGQLRVCTLDIERLREATGAWDGPTRTQRVAKPAAAVTPRASARKKGTKTRSKATSRST